MIHVIMGAPCSGKSTYVREHAKDNDLRVDYDAIAQTIGAASSHGAEGHVRSAAFEARESLISYALAHRDCESWIIHTTPQQTKLDAYKEAGAELIELDTDMETCLARAEQDGRPEGTAENIRKYFERRKSRFFNGGQMQYKYALAAPDVDGGSVKGYASTFDRDPDSYGDVIAKGAFSESLKRWEELGMPIPLLYGHKTDDPEYNIGAVTLAKEDEKGLYIEADFDAENPKAQYVRKLVQEGRLFQFSFAFEVLDAAPVTLENGTKANELRKLEIYEVSLVQIPANQHAEVVEIKSGRRNSKADETELRNALEKLGEVQNIITGLIEAEEEPEPEAEEQPEANAEEPKANAEELEDANAKEIQALIDEANSVLTKG